MKKLLLVLLVIAGLAGAAPFLSGIKARQAYDRLARQLEQNSYVLLEKQDYKYGYLESSARATVRPDWDRLLENQDPEIQHRFRDLEFRVTQKIIHGPFPDFRTGDFRPAQAKIVTTLDLTREARTKILPLFSDSQPLVLYSWIEFSGDSRTDFRINDYRSKNADGEISLKGAKGFFNFYTTGKRVKGQSSIDSFNILIRDTFRMTVMGMRMDVDTLPDPSGMFIGDLRLRLDRFHSSGTDKNHRPFSLNMANLESSSSTRINSNRMISTGDITLKDLLVTGLQFAPVTCRFTIDGVDIDTLSRLKRSLHEINDRDIPEEQKQNLARVAMFSSLPGFLRKQPVLDIGLLSFYFRDEQFEFNARISVNPELVPRHASAFALLQALEIDSNITIPKALVTAIPATRPSLALSGDNTVLQRKQSPNPAQRMEKLAQQGYFRQDGRYYRSNIIMRQGQLTMNGLVVIPLQLMQSE